MPVRQDSSQVSTPHRTSSTPSDQVNPSCEREAEKSEMKVEEQRKVEKAGARAGVKVKRERTRARRTVARRSTAVVIAKTR